MCSCTGTVPYYLRCSTSLHFFICVLIPAQQIQQASLTWPPPPIITAPGQTVCTARLMGPVSHHAAGRACCRGDGAASPPPKLGPGTQRALAPPPPPEMANSAPLRCPKFARRARRVTGHSYGARIAPGGSGLGGRRLFGGNPCTISPERRAGVRLCAFSS
jgi:hypothetical protein